MLYDGEKLLDHLSYAELYITELKLNFSEYNGNDQAILIHF